MTLEKFSGGVRRTFSHWTGASILALTSASLVLFITEGSLTKLADNENIAQEQKFLDGFHQNVESIAIWQRKVAETSNKIKSGSETQKKLFASLGQALTVYKTDDMIADILLNEDLPEKTYLKIKTEIENQNIPTYNISLSGASSHFLREGQKSVFNNASLLKLSKLEKAQEIKNRVKAESELAGLSLLFMLVGSLFVGTKLSPLVASVGHESEKYLKKSRIKRQLKNG